MAKSVPRTVRIDEELADQLDGLAQQRLIPVAFTGQVDAALRLLVEQTVEAQTRHRAKVLRADRERSRQAYRDLHEGRR